MARRTFPVEFKTAAAKLVTEQGDTQKKAADSLGMDPASVRGWIRLYTGSDVQGSQGFSQRILRLEPTHVQRREQLTEPIRKAHQASRQIYGSPRVHRELLAQEIICHEITVAKLMRDSELRSKAQRRFKVQTTDSRHPHPIASSRLMSLTQSGIRISRIYRRKRVGCLWRSFWIFAQDESLAGSALRMSLRQRQPSQGVLHHSDRGVHYASEKYRAILAEHDVEVSMSRTGNCWDNAVVESFFSTLKRELVHHENDTTHEEASQSLFEFIEVFYNRQRRHSTLGYRTPAEFEESLT